MFGYFMYSQRFVTYFLRFERLATKYSKGFLIYDTQCLIFYREIKKKVKEKDFNIRLT